MTRSWGRPNKPWPPSGRRPPFWSPLLASLLFLSTTACAGLTPTAEPKWGSTSFAPAQTDVGCSAFPRLSFDRLYDTLPTIAGIKGYDDKRDAVCGKGK